jgi:ABC-type cobalamin/Fe3+-siderophores transport system ATPase subunit
VLVSSELGIGGRQSLADMNIDEDALCALDLQSLSRRALDTLSGGQRQRALIAVSLSSASRVIAIDEPTVNLDPYWRDRCMDVLRSHAAGGRVIVLATHDDDTIAPSDTVIEVRTHTTWL